MSESKPRRKLAAILAADIVGFSKKMGENEDRTLHNLKACRAITDESIETYHGRVFGSAGDSVIAEFVIDCNIKKVISCTYSDGGVGRMNAGDVVGLLSGIQDRKDEFPHVWSW